WNSLGADWVITASSRTNFASTPLKSKRLDSSRLAWSTALISSWVSTSETISKDGMAGSGRVDGCAVDRPRAAPAQGTPWLPTQRMRAVLRDLNVSRRRSGRVVPPRRVKPSPTIGIVGSAGTYGRWLRRFFPPHLGLRVLGQDRN